MKKLFLALSSTCMAAEITLSELDETKADRREKAFEKWILGGRDAGAVQNTLGRRQISDFFRTRRRESAGDLYRSVSGAYLLGLDKYERGGIARQAGDLY